MRTVVNSQHRDRVAYRLAREYLLKRLGVTEQIVEQYLAPCDPRSQELAGVGGLYWRLLSAVVGGHMYPGVIAKARGGLDRLAG